MSDERRLSRRHLLKALAGVGAGLAAAPILAACQPKVVEVTTVVEKVVKETVVQEKVVKETVVVEKGPQEVPTIRFLTRVGALGMFMKDFSRIYVDEHPDEVQVKIEEGNWEDISTKLLTAAVAGTLQDIFWQPYFYLPYNIVNGVMAELDDAAEASGMDMSIWYPWALECEKWDGKLYGIPLGVMPGWNEMIYNQDLWEEAGVEPPPWPNMQTWEEHIQDLITIKEKTGQWGVCTKVWVWGNEMINRNYGDSCAGWMAQESNFLSPEVQESCKMLYDYMQTYKIEPTASAMLEGGKTKMFLNSMVASMYDCAADIVCGWAEQIAGKFRYGYSSIPQGDRGLWGTGTWADSVNVYSGTKYPNECFNICAAVGSVEASKWTSLATGMTPGACPDAWTDPEVAAKYPLYGYEGEWFKSNTPENAAMPYNLRFTEWGTVYGAEWFPCMYGERPYNEEELNKINDKFNQTLAEPRPD